VQDVWQETGDGRLVQSFIDNVHGFVKMIFEQLDTVETNRMAE
jgi:hypothetical protein